MASTLCPKWYLKTPFFLSKRLKLKISYSLDHTIIFWQISPACGPNTYQIDNVRLPMSGIECPVLFCFLFLFVCLFLFVLFCFSHIRYNPVSTINQIIYHVTYTNCPVEIVFRLTMPKEIITQFLVSQNFAKVSC